MKSSKLIVLLLISFALALLTQYLVWDRGIAAMGYVGFPGMAADFVLEGAHGGTHGQLLAGRILSTAINTCWYALILFLCRKLVTRRPT